MDRKSLNTLEYPKVLEQLSLFTAFSASKALVRGLRPTDDIEFARVRQARTGEACRLLSENSNVNIGGARDVRQQVQLAARGGVLAAEELLDIKATLISGRDLFRCFGKLALDLPRLKEIASTLNPPEGLIEAITRVFDDKGEIKDSASDKLGAVRSDLKRATARVLEKLNNLINTPSSARMLQEPIITKRANRYVVPLRAEYKGRMKCVVQDQSASGATLFVEPLPIVELNNDRIASAIAEKEEIHRVLAELSAQIGERMGEIQEIVHQLAVLDLAFACAKYAFSLKAIAPVLLPFPKSRDEIPDPIIRFMQAWPQHRWKNDFIENSWTDGAHGAIRHAHPGPIRITVMCV